MKQFVKKKAVVVIGVILILILIANGIWYFGVYQKYKPYCQGLAKNQMGDYYGRDSEGYGFFTAMPAWMLNDGNLAVITANQDISLLIWPEIDGDYQYGVLVPDEEGISYQLPLADGLNINGEGMGAAEYEKCQLLLKENKAEIVKLLLKTKERWGVSPSNI